MALLPFDLADPFAAVAFEVFGDFDEAEDVLLCGFGAGLVGLLVLWFWKGGRERM